MANHKGEPECITCLAYERRSDQSFCTQHSSNLPMELGPYLICRLWRGRDGKGLAPVEMDRYVPRQDTLYQFDIYMVSEPRAVMQFGRKDGGAA
jgi:hypothetical protein